MTTRVREVVGSRAGTCRVCGFEGDLVIAVSRDAYPMHDRLRLWPARHERRRLACPRCGFRIEGAAADEPPA